MATASISLRNNGFELMYPHHLSYTNFVSRSPRPSEKFYVQLLPFSNLIWGLTYLTLAVFSLCFMVTFRVYQKSHLRHENLHMSEDSNVVFLLYTMAKIAEPDPIPWFTRDRWSTGKLLTFPWSLFCLLIVMFYTSKLRAHMSAVEYDDRIDTLQDVLDNGGKPWIMLEMTPMR